ncbi:hypothetical protein [Nigerium massiliense]|uniref:hypothetical protein n=1 Tax=Nigerium massiliense TaxID=1522317 RepID=UPI001C48303C|nr:hypothetical protein [Nigerium massiliense]
MGLFENPYVSGAKAERVVGSAKSAAVGMDAQRASQVLLQNRTDKAGRATLPMKAGATVYVLGNIKAESVAQYGYKVIDGNASPRPSAKGADYVLVNMSATTNPEATTSPAWPSRRAGR